ncbi:hypothetical protein V7S43_001629 [Phytophthora oleae]|uniref:Uncharacterized protein n=1 Tax=Phytophthora oleae TaxID=2107226 RepID=A0ABD3G6X4_9STRA
MSSSQDLACSLSTFNIAPYQSSNCRGSQPLAAFSLSAHSGYESVLCCGESLLAKEQQTAKRLTRVASLVYMYRPSGSLSSYGQRMSLMSPPLDSQRRGSDDGTSACGRNMTFIIAIYRTAFSY